jgi:hypothetical protein
MTYVHVTASRFLRTVVVGGVATIARWASRSISNGPPTDRLRSSPGVKRLPHSMCRQQDGAPSPEPRGGLVSVYFGLDHFANLPSATRRDYRQCAALLEPIFDTPVVKVDTPLLSHIHDRASEKLGWRRANMVRTSWQKCSATACRVA